MPMPKCAELDAIEASSAKVIAYSSELTKMFLESCCPANHQEYLALKRERNKHLEEYIQCRELFFEKLANQEIPMRDRAVLQICSYRIANILHPQVQSALKKAMHARSNYLQRMEIQSELGSIVCCNSLIAGLSHQQLTLNNGLSSHISTFGHRDAKPTVLYIPRNSTAIFPSPCFTVRCSTAPVDPGHQSDSDCSGSSSPIRVV